MKYAIVLAGCIAALAASLPMHANAAAAKTPAPFIMRFGPEVSMGAYGEAEITAFCVGNDGLPGFFVAWPPNTKFPAHTPLISTATAEVVCYGNDGHFGRMKRSIYDHGKFKE